MRLAAEDRRKQILDAAFSLALQSKYQTITRESVAIKAGCAEPLVTHYFNDMQSLKGAVLVHAIETNNDVILTQAIVNRDPKIAPVAKSILRKALDAIVL